MKQYSSVYNKDVVFEFGRLIVQWCYFCGTMKRRTRFEYKDHDNHQLTLCQMGGIGTRNCYFHVIMYSVYISYQGSEETWEDLSYVFIYFFLGLRLHWNTVKHLCLEKYFIHSVYPIRNRSRNRCWNLWDEHCVTPDDLSFVFVTAIKMLHNQLNNVLNPIKQGRGIGIKTCLLDNMFYPD